MVSPTLVKITLYDPNSLGDVGVPFEGRARFESSLWRHIEGEIPADYMATRQPFWVTFGAALMDGETVLQPATPGVAWVYLEPTDYGPLANLWWWNIQIHTTGLKCSLISDRDVYVPTSIGIVDYGDLIPVDPDAVPELPPDWQITLIEMQGQIATLQQEVADLQAGGVASINGLHGAIDIQLIEFPSNSNYWILDVSNAGAPPDPAWLDAADLLSDRIDVLEQEETAVFVSTDGSFGLPAPTGDGGEMVVTADELADIRYDGNDL